MHLPGPQKFYAFGAGLALLGGLGYFGSQKLKTDAPLSLEPLSGTPAKDEPNASVALPKLVEPSKEVIVAIAGAVKSPGLLHLRLDARVDDAIKAAGGASSDADLETINLAAKAVDGDQIYIPRKQTQPLNPVVVVEETTKVAARYRGGTVEPTYAVNPDDFVAHHRTPPPNDSPAPETPPSSAPAPSPTLDDLLSTAPTRGETSNSQASPSVVANDARSSNPGRRAGPRSSKAQPVGPVSLNTASETELETLPGVGPATARKILIYRQTRGGFRSLDEVQVIKGIGIKKFEAMRPFLRL